jgi:CHAD domain-containing protein
MHERELKFAPGPSFRLPPLTDPAAGVQAGPAETIRLVATYFDTADLRLTRAGASLRFRDPEGWTVKLPVEQGELLTRDEVHLPGEPGDPPPAAVDLVAAVVRRAPLDVVARLTTRRERVHLFDGTGHPVGEVADDEVSVLDGARLVARFRELEVEITEDAPESVATSVAARLRMAGAGSPHFVPKVVRALGPRALEPPDIGPVDPPRRDATAAELAHFAVASAVARLVAHDPGVRAGDDPEDVHKMRVATRRLRSDLRTFRPVVDTDWSKPVRTELEWLGSLLGAVRDAEVLLERLEARLLDLPDGDRDSGKLVLESLRATREDARVELLAGLRSDRYLGLLDELVVAAHAASITPDHDDDVEPADLLRKPWRRLRDAVDALDDDSPDAALHEVRKLAKWNRYAAEAVAPALGKPAALFARRATKLQDVLGEHQDAVVAAQWLRDHAVGLDDAPAGQSFVAGELTAIERRAGDDSRARWPRGWKRLRRVRPSTWS